MGLDTRQHAHVHGDASVIAEAAQKLTQVVDGEPVRVALVAGRIERQPRTAAQVQHHVGERFVHRDPGGAVALDPARVAERLPQRAPEHDPDVLGEVVHVDGVHVALSVHVEPDTAVPADHVQQVGEEAVADVQTHRSSVEIESDAHVGFTRLAVQLGTSRHGILPLRPPPGRPRSRSAPARARRGTHRSAPASRR